MNHHKLIKLTLLNIFANQSNVHKIRISSQNQYFVCVCVCVFMFRQQNTHPIKKNTLLNISFSVAAGRISCCYCFCFSRNCVKFGYTVPNPPFPQMILQFCRSSRKHNYCRSLPLILTQHFGHSVFVCCHTRWPANICVVCIMNEAKLKKPRLRLRLRRVYHSSVVVIFFFSSSTTFSLSYGVLLICTILSL